MSNDYFKAQGWFKNYATSSEDSRGMFQQLVKDDEEAFRLASAETDRIKEEMNKQFGSGTIKYGSEIPQPEIKTPQAIFEFSQRNPAAEGGRQGFDDGKRVLPNINKTNSGKYEAFYKNNSLGRTSTLEEAKLTLEKAKKIDPYKVKTGVIKQESLDKLDKLEQIIERENSVYKRTFKRDILKEAGWPNAWDSLDTKSDTIRKKIYKLFEKLTPLEEKMENYVNNVMLSEDALVKNFKSPMKHLAEKFNVSSGYMEQNFAKNSKAYKENKKLFTSLRNKLSFDKYSQQRADGTFMTIDELSTNQFNKPIKSGLRATPDAGNFIMNSAYRNYVESVELGRTPKVIFLGDPRIQDPKEWKFEYKGKIYGYDVGPANEIVDMPSDNRFHNRKVNNLNLTQEMGKKIHGKIFPDVYKAVDDYNEFMEIKVLNPKNGKQVSLDKLIRDANYAITGNKNFLTRSSVDYDHFNQLEEPFDNIRILDRRVNQAAGTLKGHYRNEPEKLKTFLNGVGYNKKYNSVAEYADDLTVKNQIIMDPKNFTKKKGKLVYTGPEVGTPYQEYKKFEKIKKNIDYIDGKGGTTLSSGFNTDLLMKDPAVQKLLNSKAGQAVKNAARGAAGTFGKVFGGADVVLGALDYQNNISKGQSEKEALGNAVQAMSFGLYKSGDRARVKEVKNLFVKQGGDGEIFDQATALNAKDQEINDLIFNNKKKADTFVRYAKEGRGVLTPDLEKSKADYEVLKKNLNEEIKNKIQERDNMVESYKTNLRVSEAGAPINIGGQEFFSKPFKDIKRATMDKIAEDNRKAYDMQKRQVNFTSGNIGNFLQNNIFTMNPQEKAELQRQINNMEERELYKFNLSRGMDRDNLIRAEDLLNIKSSNPDLMGVNTTKYVNYDDRKAEGGITGLRSKYEYKK